MLAETLSQAKQSEATRDLEVKKAQYAELVKKQQAQADKAYELQQNIALQQKSTGYQSAVAGSNKFLPPEIGNSPEFNPPADLKITFAPSCPEKATRAYDRIWTNLRQ